MRWTALLLLSFAMFCSYIFMDILSPIKDLMLSEHGWDSTAFGTMQGSETFLNVFVFFLIIAGIILDKMGVRFTAVLSGAVMLVGAFIKLYAVTDMFAGSAVEVWFTENLNYIPGFDELGVSPFYEGMPASAKVAAIGFMIFGCGVEMAGITVSRGIVKWFKGRETAMAMGSEMALARLGVATCMIFSPYFAKLGGTIDVSRAVAFGVVLLCIALMMFVVYFFMDKKLDAQTGEAEESDEPFQLKDLGKILTSSGFWLVALLCVLYYSAIFPFQKYAVNMFENNLNLTAEEAASIFRWFPIGAALITPFLGGFLDKRGKGATMLILGAILMISCHLVFALVLPQHPNLLLAYAAIVVLGVSFSLVPAALWPSVPKLMPERYLGSAYSLIFWVQNVGLCLVPYIIGIVLNSTNPGVSDAFQNKNQIETLEAKVEYIANIKAHEADIELYNELEAAKAAEATVEAEAVETEVEATEAVEATEEVVAEQEVVRTLPEGFDIAKCQQELDKLNKEKAAQGISNDFNYEIAVAQLEALKVEKEQKNYPDSPRYDYTATMLLFVSFGVLALLFGFWLKIEDKRKGYGLELPNIKE